MLVIPLFIQHQGCPQRCLFCDQWAIAGQGQAGGQDPVSELRRTIDTWLGYGRDHTNVQLAFFGGSFTCLDEALQRRLLEAVQPYLRHGSVHSIRLSTRPDCISEDVADLLVSYRVRTVELGAQSMNDAVLQRTRRGHRVADTRAAVAALADRGCAIGVQLMVGLPGETTTSFLCGVRQLIDLRPDFVRLYPTLALAGTGLAALYRQGHWRPLSLSRAVALTGRARDLFIEQGIRVVRMGLQPSADLEERLLAGPYHPAFGELVLSRTWYLRTRRLLVQAGPGRAVTMTISPRDYSAFVGHGRQNIKRLGALPTAAMLSVRTKPGLTRGQFSHVIN